MAQGAPAMIPALHVAKKNADGKRHAVCVQAHSPPQRIFGDFQERDPELPVTVDI